MEDVLTVLTPAFFSLCFLLIAKPITILDL
uniref:Uncharacterized protein n=1 Tax=Anguilla anguilla TaxID=7936 RepID=A0A0E9P5Y0_ANGAN